MATSPVEICNIALALLGAKAIVSLTENSDRADFCNRLYAPARDEVLRAHPWNFAQVRVALARENATPAFGFTYQYVLPTSPLCLRVNETEPNDTIYTIEATADGTGRRILTDESTLSIRYTAQITAVTLFDATFVKALAAKLAHELALSLTESPGIVDRMEKLYLVALPESRTIDGQEGSTRSADINTLVDVRQHGYRVWSDYSRNRNSI